MNNSYLYLTIFRNCLVAVGYLCGRIYEHNKKADCVGNVFVISGHFIAMIIDVFNILKDRQNRTTMSASYFFLIANFFSIIGEYQDFKHHLTEIQDTPWHDRNRLMLQLQFILEKYLPYLGHVLMAVGYALEQFQNIEPPLPSAMVLLGHLCVLTDPVILSPSHPYVQIVNLLFLLSNIFMFFYDLFRAVERNSSVMEYE